MWDVLLDALLDSLKVLALVFCFEILLSFFEAKIAKVLEKNSKVAPVLGASFGVIPQCGISVVAADLYSKHHITIGTLIAVFLSCSDEALPILFSNWNETWWTTFLLLGLKIVVGALVGILLDLFLSREKHEVEEHIDHCEGEEETHIGCCGHEIEAKKESPLHEHLIHPIVHSLKIFAYVLVINVAFGALFFLLEENGVDEASIASWFSGNRYFSPLIAVLIGLIPNCVSSVILSNLYLAGINGASILPFGALLSGLLVNAGLGMLVLLRKKESRKEALLILGITCSVSLIVGYAVLLLCPAL